MDADSLLALVWFHAWANDRILTTAAGLSDEEFRRSANLDHGSAFQTLRHLVDVDWSWREFCNGNDVGDTYVWGPQVRPGRPPGYPRFCLEVDARLRSYAESLDDAAPTESLVMSADLNDTVPRWLILAHVVNQGTQHRSEVARYLTECGHSPGGPHVTHSA